MVVNRSSDGPNIIEKSAKIDVVKCVILAGGEPQKYSRHLAIPPFKFRRVIEHSLRACIRSGLTTVVVCDEHDRKLIDFLSKKYSNVGLIHPKDRRMISSFDAAFSCDSFGTDKIIIAGDLLDIKSDDIYSMSKLNGKDVLSTLKKPFKRVPFLHGQDGTLKIRTDVGQGVFRLSKESQSDILDPEFLEQSLAIRERFYGERILNENTANDVWTWLLFNFFNEIYGHSEARPLTGRQVLVDYKINSANDYDK